MRYQLFDYEHSPVHSPTRFLRTCCVSPFSISEKLLPADAADAVDTAQGQDVYETVVGHARCEGFTDILNCLREVDYDKILHAINAVPGILSYSSIALSTELPSPNHPTSCFLAGKMTTVPFILGIQEDEGAPFALSNSTSPPKAGWHCISRRNSSTAQN
ncbi:lipase 2 [Histoplasma capsulatum G186AR]|uniref:Lipase 2 n=1 Tax=Ajellomyces capsulatus (strain G186AR / H82 / ATCC MYA-2454 / RMSCC 2432) TaxID=447093 RepID=C0P080_AJECG|nr:lipase 2 [Histoplasma capsulatum G186AR]EEH02896.1 lipase 2 [Histoplasma capsulatum G186AR]